jgi:hypothetical protein
MPVVTEAERFCYEDYGTEKEPRRVILRRNIAPFQGISGGYEILSLFPIRRDFWAL